MRDDSQNWRGKSPVLRMCSSNTRRWGASTLTSQTLSPIVIGLLAYFKHSAGTRSSPPDLLFRSERTAFTTSSRANGVLRAAAATTRASRPAVPLSHPRPSSPRTAPLIKLRMASALTSLNALTSPLYRASKYSLQSATSVMGQSLAAPSFNLLQRARGSALHSCRNASKCAT